MSITGNLSASKLGNTALRTIDGRCFLNGVQVEPEEVMYTGEE